MIPIIIPRIGEGSQLLPTPHMVQRLKRLHRIMEARGIKDLAAIAYESEWWVRHRARCPLCHQKA